MKRLLTFALMLAAAPLLWAQEGRAWTPEPFTLGPFDRRQANVVAVVGQESRAIAIGDGRSPIGIYVFDPQGRCVAFDDEPVKSFIDDRIASWVPSGPGPYEVQVRNLGVAFNKVDASAK